MNWVIKLHNAAIPIRVVASSMKEKTLDPRDRKNIRLAAEVEVVQKKDQYNGDLTHGFVLRILTKSAFHPHGIKVQLEGGEVGRVKNILSEE